MSIERAGDNKTYDALIAEFFSMASPDWNTPLGQQVLQLTASILERFKKTKAWLYGSLVAEDVAQDAFVKITGHVQRGNPVRARNWNQYRAFCKTTFVNASKDYHRKRKRENLHAFGIEPENPEQSQKGYGYKQRIEKDPKDLEERVACKDLVVKLLECVRSINPRHRDFLELDKLGLTTSELMQQMSLSSANNVSQLRRRSRLSLKECYDIIVS